MSSFFAGECGFLWVLKPCLSLGKHFFTLMEPTFKNYDDNEVQVNRSGIIIGGAIAGLSVFLLVILVLISARRHRAKVDNESQRYAKRTSVALRSSQPSEQPRPQDTISELPAPNNLLSNSSVLRSVSRIPSMLLKSASLSSATITKSASTVPEGKEPENKRYSKLKAFYSHPAEVPNWIASSPLVRSPQSIFESLRSTTPNQAGDNNKDHTNIV